MLVCSDGTKALLESMSPFSAEFGEGFSGINFISKGYCLRLVLFRLSNCKHHLGRLLFTNTCVSEDSPLSNNTEFDQLWSWSRAFLKLLLWSTFKDLEPLKVFSRIHTLWGLHLFGQRKVFQREEPLSRFSVGSTHTSDLFPNRPYFS